MGSAESSDHEAPHSGTSPAKVSPDSQQFSSSEPTVILDSGVAFHATSNLEIFSPDVDDRGAAGDCAPFHRRDGTVLRVAGVGTVESCDKNFRLPGVRYVPQLGPGVTLVSVQQLAASGFLLMFCGAFCYVTDVDNGGRIVGKGRLSEDNGFYHLDFLRVPECAAAVEDGKMGRAAA